MKKIPKSEQNRFAALIHLQSIQEFRDAVYIGWLVVVGILIGAAGVVLISFLYHYLRQIPCN